MLKYCRYYKSNANSFNLVFVYVTEKSSYSLLLLAFLLFNASTKLSSRKTRILSTSFSCPYITMKNDKQNVKVFVLFIEERRKIKRSENREV